jgi:DNA-binding response OmpR family regulator
VKRRVLVVDQDPQARATFSRFLTRDGLEVTTAATEVDALRWACTSSFDVIVVHWNLALVRTLRLKCRTPVLVYSGRIRTRDELVSAYAAGAEQYVTTPLERPEELFARVTVLSGHTSGAREIARMDLGDLVIDVRRHSVEVRGAEIDLSPMEFDALGHLAAHAGEVVDYERLARVIGTSATSHARRVHAVHNVVNRLRTRLGTASDAIESVARIGYRLRKRASPG